MHFCYTPFTDPLPFLQPYMIDAIHDRDDNVEIILNEGTDSDNNDNSRNSSNENNRNGSRKNKKSTKNSDRGNRSGRDRADSAAGDGKINILGSLMNVWSVLTFSWMRPLMVIGNRRAIEQHDLYELSYHDSSEGVYKRFSYFWKIQLKKRETINKNPNEIPVPGSGSGSKKKLPLLSVALLRAFGAPFAGAGFLKLIHDTLLFVGPLALNQLIIILNDPSKPLSLGLYYVAAIFGSNFIMSLCLRQYFWYVR